MSKKRVRRRHKCPDCWRVNVICKACQADIDAAARDAATYFQDTDFRRFVDGKEEKR